MEPILHKNIPYDVTQPQRLPGMLPLDQDDWLWIDEAYDPQMALRRDLIERQRDRVIACDPRCLPAAQELLASVLAFIGKRPDFSVTDQSVVCPDGVGIRLDWADPFKTLGSIVQNDFCILQKPVDLQGDAYADEHVLTGAVLCFPASWRLDEKFMRPLRGIHDTVAPYDEGVAKRVQRLFDAIRVDGPLWRFNALYYRDPTLHQPNGQHSVRDATQLAEVCYVRSERQSLMRLATSQAVVFGIHTLVVRRGDVGDLPVSPTE